MQNSKRPRYFRPVQPLCPFLSWCLCGSRVEVGGRYITPRVCFSPFTLYPSPFSMDEERNDPDCYQHKARYPFFIVLDEVGRQQLNPAVAEVNEQQDA